MSKHTPGPWKAGYRSVSAQETEERLGLDVRLYGGNAVDSRANASLIAAAPDLLDALLRMVDSVTGVDQVSAVNEARAAIAKATGCDA